MAASKTLEQMAKEVQTDMAEEGFGPTRGEAAPAASRTVPYGHTDDQKVQDDASAFNRNKNKDGRLDQFGFVLAVMQIPALKDWIEDADMLRSIFNMLDVNGDGELDAAEFGNLGSGKAEDFLHFVATQMKWAARGAYTRKGLQDLENMFLRDSRLEGGSGVRIDLGAIFDEADADHDGYLSAEELLQMLKLVKNKTQGKFATFHVGLNQHVRRGIWTRFVRVWIQTIYALSKQSKENRAKNLEIKPLKR